MCGIVGYIGKKNTDLFSILKAGLIGLEYRGYDSAGVTFLAGKGFEVIKCVGSPTKLTATTTKLSSIGIGHTRWATHGGISERNAHPHFDCKGEIAVVHNGTIENFAELTAVLKKAGHRFTSTTDTEVIAHLIEAEMKKSPFKTAVERALSRVVGAFGIAVISKKEPHTIIAARRGSPLLIGIGKDSLMVASDQNALVAYCKHVVYLDENELVVLTPDRFSVTTLAGASVIKQKHALTEQEQTTGKGRYKHYMLKEIEEQAETLAAGMSGRLDEKNGMPVLGGIRQILPRLKNVSNIIITGCGTAYHAALYGKYLFEQIVGVPVRAEIASELLYEKVNEPPDRTLVIFVSQSGETADTKDVLVELKQRGFLCIGIVNVAGSSIAREAGAGIYIRAGVERAVASTKAFTSQMLALALLGVTMARQRGMSKIEGSDILAEFKKIPSSYRTMMRILKPKIRTLAKKLVDQSSLTFLGKKYSYPVALEAALKVKEISYLVAESYPAGELKHGPLALVDKDFVAFVIAPENNLFDKLSNTIHEIQARGGSILLVTNQDRRREKIIKAVRDVIFVPPTKFNFVYPFYTVLPFQFLSYELALLLNRDIDKPRNLAKSVTVH